MKRTIKEFEVQRALGTGFTCINCKRDLPNTVKASGYNTTCAECVYLSLSWQPPERISKRVTEEFEKFKDIIGESK